MAAIASAPSTSFASWKKRSFASVASSAVLAGRICGLTGVWCGLGLPQNSSKGLPCAAPSAGRKIAAIGIHVARGVTSHGFAFNVTTDLRDFALINPCGITDRPVTSLAREVTDPSSLPSLESLAHMAARQFGLVFNEPILALESLAVLRAQAQASAESALEPPAPAAPDPDSSTSEFPAPVFPANDTPLQIPPEIERLRRTKDRPIPA